MPEMNQHTMIPQNGSTSEGSGDDTSSGTKPAKRSEVPTSSTRDERSTETTKRSHQP